MDIPTKPGFLPAYRESPFTPSASVYEITGPTLLVGATNRVVVRRVGLIGRVSTGEFRVPAPDNANDGFNQVAVDRALADRGWRRTSEWDWPHGAGAYVANIERIT
jgi:hypothetical protein